MKSRGMLIASVAAMLIAASSTDSFAQGRGGRGGFGRGGMSAVSLAGNGAVQKDLGVSEDQKSKLTKLGEEYADERMKLFAEVSESLGDTQSLSEGERFQKMGAAMGEATKKLNDKFAPKLKEILEPKQQDRLKQIGWQAAGTAAYSDPEVVKALGISKEQEEKFAAIVKEQNEKMAAARANGQGGGGGAGNRLERFQQMREEQEKKYAEVLSKEQQDKFTELKGKPFDVAQLGGGGRGGRGGGERGEGRRRRGGEEKSEQKSEEKK